LKWLLHLNSTARVPKDRRARFDEKTEGQSGKVHVPNKTAPVQTSGLQQGPTQLEALLPRQKASKEDAE
jgi:hypothetical protein